MAQDARQSSGMAGVVAIGALIVALCSINWTQLAVDLFWFLVGWVLGSFDRLFDAVTWVFKFIIQ